MHYEIESTNKTVTQETAEIAQNPAPKIRRRFSLKIIFVSLFMALAGVGTLSVVFWQSNTMIAQKTETTSDASVAAAQTDNPSFYMTQLGINNATSFFTPESYYDELTKKTYVVWSGGTRKVPWYKDSNGKEHETSAMHVFIKYYDHQTGRWSQAQKVFEPPSSELYGDGHYRQGVLVDNLGYIHVFQSYHISLRPAGSTQEVDIRHAVSAKPNSITDWKVSDIPNTELNTHAFYFKSNSGDIYGIYRKTYLHELFPVGQDEFREEQWMIKSTDNGKSFDVWNAITPPQHETQEIYPGETIARKAKWDTARLAGYNFDREKNGVQMVFDFNAVRSTLIKSFYYVFFSFNDDSFYCANGTKLGKSINKTNYDALIKNCVAVDFGKSISGKYVDELIPVAMDANNTPKIYMTAADINSDASKKYLHEYSYNKSNNTWSVNKLSSLGTVLKAYDVAVQSPTKKYIIGLTPSQNTTPGMADSWVFRWDGSSWSKYRKITNIENFLYPQQQTRHFNFTTNEEKNLSGFFINFREDNLKIHETFRQEWDAFVWGYYEGYVATKLLWFKIDDGSNPPAPPVCSKINWPTSIPVTGSGKFEISASDPDSIAGSTNPDVRFYITKKMDDYCIPKGADGTTLGKATDGRWQQVGTATAVDLSKNVPVTLDNSLLKLPAGRYMMTANVTDNDNYFTTGNPGKLFSTGTGAGCGYTYNSCSGEFEIVDPNAPPTTNKQITFPAKGTYSGGAWPKLELRIKNSSGTYQSMETFTIDSTTYKNFTYTHTTNLTADQVRLAFVNDNGPRDVWVDYLKIGSNIYQTEAPTTYSTGTWNNDAKNCDAYYPSSEKLNCNGEFHFLKNVELLQSTRVNIVAKGVFSNEAWPLLEIWIKNSKGVYEKKKSIPIDSNAYKTFSYDQSTPFDASQVRLKFVNDNGPRDVQIRSIKFGTATYPTNAYGTYSTGSWNSSTKKCTAGYPYNNSAYPSKDILACNGYFDYFKR